MLILQKNQRYTGRGENRAA